MTPLPEGVTGHRVLLLPTGDVLICGGMNNDGSISRTSYLYSSRTGTFRPTINQLNTARAWHGLVAVKTTTGERVLAIGGFNGAGGSYSSSSSVEVLEFDGAQNNWRWRPVGNLPVGRGDLRAVWDGGSYVVVTGGYEQNGGALRSGTRSTMAERIEVNTLQITPLAAMGAPRAEHAAGRIIDDNGNLSVLVAGGETNTAATGTQILEAGVWNAVANPPLAYHSGGVGLGDRAGIARIFGGFDGSGVPIDLCEWYDVKRGWRSAPRMNTARARFTAPLIAGLSDTALAYIALGGTGRSGPLAQTEIFELPGSSFPNGGWTPFSPLRQAGAEREGGITGSNLAIVTGGSGSGGVLNGVELFQPLSAPDLSFGDEEIGRRSDSIQLVIRNEWLLPVRVTNFRAGGSAAFFYRGDTANFVIPAGSARTVRLYFQPGSPGAHTGELLFDVGELTDTVRLRGNGIASSLAVINSPADLGAVFVSSRKSFCFYALRNNGTDTSRIDSVSLDPVGTFRLVSPKGRVEIPPGDSLQICVEFVPTVRGDESAVLNIHIADRTFPAQVIGHAVRRYLTASIISNECDTITYVPGAETSGFITLTNPGDSLVTVEMPILTQSVVNLFRLADPTLFPLTLLPGETRQIEVIFAPVRESREAVTVGFPNNGDTSAAVTLCFIARSRFLSVSQPSLDFGSLCAGDSVTATLVIENPGGFESVDLIDATITPSADLQLSGFTPITLGPRQYTRVTVRYAPQGAGTLNAALTVRNSRGDLVIPITATVLAPLLFRPADGAVPIGGTITLPVRVEGLAAGTSINRATLQMEYDPALLLPLRILPSPTGPPLNQSATTIERTGKGEMRITVEWTGPITADGEAFGIEVEGLRGDARSSRITLLGEGIEEFCLAKADGEIESLPPCWGDAGFIRTGKLSFLYAWPQPADAHLSIVMITPMEGTGTLDILNARGEVVATREISADNLGTRTVELDTRDFPAGLYLLRGRIDEETVGTTRIIIGQ